jgi:hypothetical protein
MSGQAGQTGGQGTGGTLHDVKERVSDAVGQVTDKARDLAAQAGNRLSDAWQGARDSVSGATDVVTDKAGDAWEGFTNAISRYPVASVCVAFGLGYLTASLFSMNWSSDMAGRMSRSS